MLHQADPSTGTTRARRSAPCGHIHRREKGGRGGSVTPPMTTWRWPWCEQSPSFPLAHGHPCRGARSSLRRMRRGTRQAQRIPPGPAPNAAGRPGVGGSDSARQAACAGRWQAEGPRDEGDCPRRSWGLVRGSSSTARGDEEVPHWGSSPVRGQAHGGQPPCGVWATRPDVKVWRIRKRESPPCTFPGTMTAARGLSRIRKRQGPYTPSPAITARAAARPEEAGEGPPPPDLAWGATGHGSHWKATNRLARGAPPVTPVDQRLSH